MFRRTPLVDELAETVWVKCHSKEMVEQACGKKVPKFFTDLRKQYPLKRFTWKPDYVAMNIVIKPIKKKEAKK